MKWIRWKNPPYTRKLGIFMDLVQNVMIYANSKALSQIFVLLKLKEKKLSCEDCGNYFTHCKCEGSTELNYEFGERIYEPCEDCHLNYCLCDYDISGKFNTKNEKELKNQTCKIRELAWKLAKENLNMNQLHSLRQRIINNMNDAIFYEQVLDIINEN